MSIATSIPFDYFVGLDQQIIDTYLDVLEEQAEQMKNGGA